MTTDSNIVVRLSVVGGDAVKAELQTIGDAGDQHLARVAAPARTAADALVALQPAAGQASRSLAELEGVATSAATSLSNTDKALAASVEHLNKLGSAPILSGAERPFLAMKEDLSGVGEELGATATATEWVTQQLEQAAAKHATIFALMRAGVSSGAAGAAGWAVGAGFALQSMAQRADEAMKVADEANAVYTKLNDTLWRTGYSAGHSAEMLVALARGQESASKYTRNEIAGAANELLKFKSIGDEILPHVTSLSGFVVKLGTDLPSVFPRVLSLTQDLATKLGTDLPTAAGILGKAMEDPVEGIDELADAGVRLTNVQRDQIREFQDVGNAAAAQNVVLDAVRDKLGGAARVADETAAATKRLENSYDHLMAAVGARLNELKNGLSESFGLPLTVIKELMTSANRGWAEIIGPKSASQQIVQTTRDLIQAKADLEKARAEEDRNGTDYARLGETGESGVTNAERRVAELQKRQDDLLKRARQDSKTLDEQRDAARGEQRQEKLNGIREGLDSAIEKFHTPVERIKAVNDELATTKKRLEALRAPNGENKSEIDAELAKADKLAKAKREVIEKEVRREGKEREGVDRAILEQVTAMEGEREALALTERARAVHVATLRAEQVARRAGRELTLAERAAIEQEAGALADAKHARDAHNKAIQDGTRLTEQLRTPHEKLADELWKIQGLLDAGAIGWETYARAEDAANKTAREAGNKTSDVARQVGMSFESAFESAVIKGRKLSEVLGSLAQDLAKLAMRKMITEPLFNAMGSALSSTLGSISLFHTGGVVGADRASSRAVTADVFAGAPRYHSGGMIGADEVPAILQKGEGVFTAEQMKALGTGGSGGMTLNAPINITIGGGAGGAAGDHDQHAALAQQIGGSVRRELDTLFDDHLRRHMRPGGLLNSMR